MAEPSRFDKFVKGISSYAKIPRPAGSKSRQTDSLSNSLSTDSSANKRTAGSSSQQTESDEYLTPPEGDADEGYVVLRKEGKGNHDVSVLVEDFEVVQKDESHLASSPMRNDFEFEPSLSREKKRLPDSSPFTDIDEKSSEQKVTGKVSNKQQKSEVKLSGEPLKRRTRRSAENKSSER